MSCKQCQEFQESEATSYYRWKNANIEIRACHIHLTEIFSALDFMQKDENLNGGNFGYENRRPQKSITQEKAEA